MARDALLEKVAQFYDQAIVRYGAVSQGVNWKDPREQELRFAYLAEILNDERAPISVADIGCGYGALFDYLAGHGHKVREYVGYDVAPAMVESARARLAGRPEASFVQGAALDRDVDYAFASGTFNVKLGQDDLAWRKLVERTLENMNARTHRGFAFNVMTDRVDWRDEALFYANASEFLDLCLKKFSRHVRLLHDMPLYEWTMLVFKQ